MKHENKSNTDNTTSIDDKGHNDNQENKIMPNIKLNILLWTKVPPAINPKNISLNTHQKNSSLREEVILKDFPEKECYFKLMHQVQKEVTKTFSWNLTKKNQIKL